MRLNTTQRLTRMLAGAMLLPCCAVMAQQNTTVVQTVTSLAASLPEAVVTEPASLKFVGGGARTNWTGSGNLLTATWPTTAGSGAKIWIGWGKDHLVASPATLTAYGVGLTDPNDDWEVGEFRQTSAVAAHPVATASLPAGYALTGGGCLVDWRRYSSSPMGNLLTASFPSSLTTWECRSKDHSVSSPASITAFVMGIRPKKAGIALPTVQITTVTSAVTNHPTAVAPALPGWVVTGGGARALPADPAGAGQLLTGTFPTTALGSQTPTGWYAAAKDHAVASPGTVQAFAINLKFAEVLSATLPPGGVIGLIGSGVPLGTAIIAGQPFRHCTECPLMKPIPAGTFLMGSPESEPNRHSNEGPQRTVRVPAFFAGVTEVTWAQWDACVAALGCDNAGPQQSGGSYSWGRGSRPAINMSWHDAQSYVQWLTQRTGRRYRLLTEAEWEYAARAGTTTPYYTGSTIIAGTQAQAASQGTTVEVGTKPPNPFGLYDMHGNVREWVEDCANEPYAAAPVDGSAYLAASNCKRMMRDGAYNQLVEVLRSAKRQSVLPTTRSSEFGFRVALSP